MSEPYISWKQVGERPPDTQAGSEVSALCISGRTISPAIVVGTSWTTKDWTGVTGLAGSSDSHEMAKEEALAAAEKQGFLAVVKPTEHGYADSVAHKERHKLLHSMLDELIADYINHSNKRLGQTTIMDLISWSHSQTIEATSNTLSTDSVTV